MDAEARLAANFDEHRERLRGMGIRLLGSRADADDVIQETWLKLSRTDHDQIVNLGGWLTTAYVRVCLDALRARGHRREELHEPVGVPRFEVETQPGPEDAVVLADSVGAGMLIVLDVLGPAERVAFVLHDVFRIPFADIGVILEKSTDAAKMLASRARRRIGGDRAEGGTDPRRAREVVHAFLLASRHGDFTALLQLLDPDAMLEADDAATRMGAAAEVLGAREVAATVSGRAQAAVLALLDMAPGWVWRVAGMPKVVFEFDVRGGRICAVKLSADPDYLAGLEIVDLES